ncbi:hypothetical protein Bca52824_023750 [Brassica carinata]|uniref:Uncharacterized protein n=1 Tax=Brassica carinata TaxID=52824 RepID=A0A8X7VJB8_BRACI|nr:hypothetical protein Bca52824_023750 [Brassica carinata]
MGDGAKLGRCTDVIRPVRMGSSQGWFRVDIRRKKENIGRSVRTSGPYTRLYIKSIDHSSKKLARDNERMQARMDTQQERLDSLKSFLDVMAVGNPTMQRALADRRAALGMQQPDPEAGTSSDPNASANYFDDDVGL